MIQKNGFTLIELLVVIAVISLLISILVPTLNSARDLAKTVVCLSTLRRFGTADTIHHTENDGWHFPIASFVDNGFNTPKDGTVMVLWFNTTDFREAMGWSTDPSLFGSKWITAPKEAICPKASLALSNSYKTYRRMDYSYGMNIQRHNERPIPPYPDHYYMPTNLTQPADRLAVLQGRNFSSFRESDIQHPAQKLEFADSLEGNLTKYHSNLYQGEQRTFPNMTAYRHGGKVNILFFDGHADTTPRADVDAGGTWGVPHEIWDVLD